MCDVESERKRIDALIEGTISPFWFDDPDNRRALVEFTSHCLYADYCDTCSEDCIRARCEAYVARRVRSRSWLGAEGEPSARTINRQ